MSSAGFEKCLLERFSVTDEHPALLPALVSFLDYGFGTSASGATGGSDRQGHNLRNEFRRDVFRTLTLLAKTIQLHSDSNPGR